MRSISLVVPREGAGARLDRFLANALAGLEDPPSRSELQRWIDHGSVTVDGATRRPADKLREGARIEVVPEAPPRAEAVADARVAFELVHVDDDVIVIDKPPGLVVHPARGHATGTLVNGLLGRGLFKEGEPLTDDDEVGHTRPGIVHRIDKGTSGLLVVARTARAREALKAQFAAHTVDREYLAICVGDVKKQSFATLHGRHPTDRLRFSSKVKTGKRAVTHVAPVERFGGHATLVSCRLETGRTHQIRVHLADNRTPLLGDALYGPKPPKHPVVREAAMAIGRAALHARVLGFVHPRTGEAVRFVSEPPSDFEMALATLRAIP